MQDVFLLAAKGLDTVRDPRATRAWLATVTVRTARKKLRRRRWKMILSLDEAAACLAISPATAKRYWVVARAWLFAALSETGDSDRK